MNNTFTASSSALTSARAMFAVSEAAFSVLIIGTLGIMLGVIIISIIISIVSIVSIVLMRRKTPFPE